METYWTVNEVNGSTFLASSGAQGKGMDAEMSFSSSGRPAVGDTIATGNGTGYRIVDPVFGSAPEFRYFNFSSPPETDDTALDRSIDDTAEGKTKHISHSPFAFRDIPPGTQTMEAKNGAVVMAGEALSGVVMTSSNKIILRDDNSMEIVTPHSVVMQGHTVTVSSFTEGFTLEIDLVDTGNIGNSSLSQYISAVHTLVKDGMSYAEAYRTVVGQSGGFEANMADLFGLHVGDIVLASKWTRIKIVGNIEHVASTYFGTGPISIYELGLYNDGSGNIALSSYIEAFLTDTVNRTAFAILSPPSCWDMQNTVVGIKITTEQGDRSVSSMTTHLSNGKVVVYGTEQVAYVEKNAVVGKELFVSAHTHKSTANVFHRDHKSELMSEIRIGSSGQSLCGESVNFSRLVFTNDANILVEGDVSLFAQGSILMQSPSTARLVAGGKGLLVDSSGVSTTS